MRYSMEWIDHAERLAHVFGHADPRNFMIGYLAGTLASVIARVPHSEQLQAQLFSDEIYRQMAAVSAADERAEQLTKEHGAVNPLMTPKAIGTAKAQG